MNRLLLATFVFAFAGATHAKDVKIGQYREDIKPFVRAANVWTQPAWMDKNLKFVGSPDLINGPKAKGYTQHFMNDTVNCQTAQEDQDRDFGGKTPKFYCQLLEVTSKGLNPVVKDNGGRQVIKVKYASPGEVNNEIYGEILGTRLMWALGFGADQMFYVDTVKCKGCTEDPYNDRRVVPNSVEAFSPTALEKKISGDELLFPEMITVNGTSKKIWTSGVRFREMMENLPTDPAARKVQLARRDALRLLAVFMQHTDLKPDNQRFVCSNVNNKGQCENPFMMIQDIGASFGVGLKNLKLDKVNLETWKNTPIWDDADDCEAQLSSSSAFKVNIKGVDGSMSTVKVSESGRQFLATLLSQFAADKERVRELFRAAHIEERGLGETVEDWTNAFLSRVEQIKNPTGKAGFKCPKSPYE